MSVIDIGIESKAFDYSPKEMDVLASVRTAVQTDLQPLVSDIDDGLYPGEFMRSIGHAGAYRMHTGPNTDLNATIESMALISEACLSTSFMSWCQNALVWYILNSDNEALKSRYLAKAASADILGGTGLSNPMKALYGIETLKLKGKKVEGGYLVRGVLPWVSNLGSDHIFGAIFEDEDAPGHTVMCLIDCASNNVNLKPCEPFLGLDGTGTYAVQIRDHLVTEDQILADPALPYVKKIRAGFVLLQAGMAIGLVRDCIAMMEGVKPSLGHVNSFLDVQPEDIGEQLADLEAEVQELARSPYDTSDTYWRRVLKMRLAGGEASVAAAHHAMLHCGARGYVKRHRCQRRLRESYFVAIVTPATKQLRKMIAELG